MAKEKERITEKLQKKKLKLPPTSSTSKCYYHLRHLQVSKLKKTRPHSTFFPTLCFLLSHLAHSDEDPNDQDKMKIKGFTPINKKRMTAYLSQQLYSCLSPSSLFLLSSNLGMRFCLRGVDLSHHEISEFQDVNRKNNLTMIFP